MGQSKQTSRVNMGPWGPTQEPLQTGIGRIEDQYQTDVANPNRLVPQATGYTSDVLSGSYLSPTTNPHYADLVKSISDPIRSQTAAMFGRAGRGTSASSSGLAGAVTRNLATGLAPTLAGMYGAERGIMEGAAGRAPALDATASLPLEQYLERLRALGSLGQKGTTTTTGSPSPLQTIAGIGLTAAGLMSGNPMLAMGGMGGIPKV